MSSEWEEIKRLAADLQRVQLTSSSQKLSEQNCVEIVNLLLESKSIELIFTDDGKEYVTPQQVLSEIKDELYVCGGRANIVDIAKALNVDLSLVTQKVNEIIRSSKEYHFVLGQLIDSTYRSRIANEINVKLRNYGQVFIADLSLQYDLPADYLLHNIVEKEIGHTIQCEQDSRDPRILQTVAFISCCKAKIRGAITGFTSPTPVATILSLCNVSEHIFHSCFDQPWFCGTLTSKLPGALFIPNIYSKSQSEWVNNFFKQNNYLEYDSLSRWGIMDAKSYIMRTFPKESFMFLQSCALGSMYVNMLEATIDECISSKSYVDIATVVPSVVSLSEIEECLLQIMKSKGKETTMLFDTTVFSYSYIDALFGHCKTEVEKHATAFVESGRYQKYMAEKQLALKKSDSDPVFSDVKSDRREERRRKAATGKGGGGTQGRETKTKSTKKHVRGKKTFESDDESVDNVISNPDVPELMALEDIEKILLPNLQNEGLDDLCNTIAQHLLPTVNKHGLAHAKVCYESKLHTSTSNRRQNHIALQDKFNSMINDVRLYEKGIRNFGPDTQTQLKKYLLKTLCNDITNLLTNYFAQESGRQEFDINITTEQRSKIIGELSNEFKTVLLKNITMLSGSSIEDFLESVENCLSLAGVTLRKIDKKKDRTTILCHKHGLLEQLSNSSDPAIVLHVACLAMYTVTTQTMLHASGKFINEIVKFLQAHLPAESHTKITEYQTLVMKYLNIDTESEEGKNIHNKLIGGIEEIKEIAVKFKKQSSAQED